jgi:hypothetical protein
MRYNCFAKIVSCIGILAVIVVCVLILLTRNRPVLYAYRESGSLHNDPLFVILNPFRNRAPERVAQRFMSQLNTNLCNSLVQPIRPNYTEMICFEEKKYPVLKFHLANRQDLKNNTKLLYRIERSGLRRNIMTNSILELHKDDSEWRVTDFQPIY